MGFVRGPKNKSLQERERISRANLDTVHTSRTMAAVVTVTYNLRNVGGQNFTLIRDQGNCGFCVAFGTVATVEGRSRTQANNPNPNMDLSEADLFYCHGFNDGRNCQNGWWPGAALNHFTNGGVVNEACYPYTAGDQKCSNLCSDWNNRLIKIAS